jgi:hypothetical protein
LSEDRRGSAAVGGAVVGGAAAAAAAARARGVSSKLRAAVAAPPRARYARSGNETAPPSEAPRDNPFYRAGGGGRVDGYRTPSPKRALPVRGAAQAGGAGATATSPGSEHPESEYNATSEIDVELDVRL